MAIIYVQKIAWILAIWLEALLSYCYQNDHPSRRPGKVTTSWNTITKFLPLLSALQLVSCYFLRFTSNQKHITFQQLALLKYIHAVSVPIWCQEFLNQVKILRYFNKPRFHVVFRPSFAVLPQFTGKHLWSYKWSLHTWRNRLNESQLDHLWNKVKCQIDAIGNFIDVFLARHVSGTYAHHQER